MEQPPVRDTIAASYNWLLSVQSQGKGWAERGGEDLSVLNTAEIVISLIDAREHLPDDPPPTDPRITAAVDYLVGCQAKRGAEKGCWPRTFTVSGKTRKLPDLVRTALAVEAVAAARGSAAAKDAVAWLEGMQNPDGGWPYRRGAESRLIPTCFALLGLLAAGGTNDATLRSGLDYVREKQKPDGSITEVERLRAAETTYAALALQRARQCKVDISEDAERRALGWLASNPGEALRAVEATIPIDPQPGPPGSPSGNYDFLFMNDASLVRLLARSNDVKQTDLAREAMQSLARKERDAGVFYGERVFTWATARAMQAYAAADAAGVGSVPERRPAVSGSLATALIALLIVVFGVLAFTGNFDGGTLLGIVVLVIAALAVGGFIGERTIRDLLSNFIDKLPSPGGGGGGAGR